MSVDTGHERPLEAERRALDPDGSEPRRRTDRLTLGVLTATLASYMYLAIGSVVFGLLAMLFGWVPPRGNALFFFGRLWSRGLLWTSGVRLRTSGVPLRTSAEADFHPRERYIFMPNHQSMYDIPVMFCSLPSQTRFMAKAGLFRIPIFGWAMAVGGFIPVDRKNRSRASETFSAAVDRLRSVASIVIFPEETRSPDGRLLPFKRGGFLLALKSSIRIVPVGIRGTIDVRRRGGWLVRPGIVEVCYGKPIDVSGSGLRQKSELMSQVRTEMARLAGLGADSGEQKQQRGHK